MACQRERVRFVSKKIIETSSFIQSKECDAVETADGMVVYQTGDEKVHYLNPTAAVIYTLCDTEQTLETIANFLKDIYDLPDTPTTEVRECVELLLEQSVVDMC